MVELQLDERGCVGDRVWSVRTAENKIGSGKTTRRFTAVPGLLQLRAEHAEGTVMVTHPDGSSYPVDHPDAARGLSAFVRRPLTFRRETDVSHFDDGPVSILGLASVQAVSAVRGEAVVAAGFRANIVLATSHAYLEEEWLSRCIRLGTAVVRVDLPSPRCVMINMKTADLPAQAGNLKTVARINDGQLGVIASVVQPGTVRLGDDVVPM